MLRELPLPGPQHRPAAPPVVLAAARACAAAPSPLPSGGIEAEVLETLLGSDLPAGPLLDAIASRAAAALQEQAAGLPIAPAELRGVAARIATGLAVALLQSDLNERIAARLAAEAPFADGWRSCPE